MSETRPEYPLAICLACGNRWGRRPLSISDTATWYIVRCDLCGQDQPCTQPRDFGHLREGWEKGAKNA